MSPSIYSIPISQPGDIIFLRQNSRKSLNIHAQSLIRGKRALYSHIAIAVKQGNAIHSMPREGVHVVRVHDLLNSSGATFQVFRHIVVNATPELHTKLEDGLWYFNQQKYNKRFFMRTRNNASFCSELASKAYAKINIEISRKPSSHTLPVDIFEKISKNEGWLEVTDLYKDFFLDKNFDSSHNLASDFVRRLECANQIMVTQRWDLIYKLSSQSENLDMPIILTTPSRSYWNIDRQSYRRQLSKILSSIRKKFRPR